MKKHFFITAALGSPSAAVFSFFFFLFSFSTARAQIITTIAGNGTGSYSGDNIPATTAELDNPWGVAVDAAGNVYIGDFLGMRIRKVDGGGIITTVAGTGIGGYGGEGVPATSAELDEPSGVFLDGSGNVYIADLNNEEVRKVDATGIITDFAGDYALGVGGHTGDGGPATAAQLWEPRSMAMDGAGNMYIADVGNHGIRKVDPSGTISTIAGIAGGGGYGYSGDGGPASAAKFDFPEDIAVDDAGNIYIADQENHRIRKINTAGIITTIAGNGVGTGTITGSYSGDGGPATAAGLWDPSGVAVDALGNVYIGDYGNNRVRKVDRAGIITTIAGMGGTGGYTGDGVPATATKLHEPAQIRLDCGGNLYIADQYNNRIRKVTYDNAPYFMGGHTQYLSVCENATATAINTLLAATDIDTLQTATWSLVLPPAHGAATVAYSATTTRGLLTPTGAVYTPTTGYTGYDTLKVVVEDCGFLTDTTTIYVYVNLGPATDTIAGAAGLCLGTPLTLTDDSTGGAWGVTNSHASVTGGVVNGLSAGADTVTYSMSNSCGTTTVLHPVTVSATAFAGGITGPGLVCFGTPATLTDAAPDGLWSSSSTAVSVSGGVVTGVTAGTSMISYTVTNYCGTAFATASITASPMPNAGAITGSATVCVSASVTLSDTVTGGAWGSSNIDAAISGGVVTGAFTGLDTMSYYYTNVCGTAIATHTINVLPLPDAGSISGPGTVCVGGNILLTDPADGGGGTWTASNGDVSVSGGIVSGRSAGSSTITYSVTNSCGTATAIYTVSISSFVPVTYPITGPASEFCAGSTLTLSEAATGGVWSGSNGNALVSGGVVSGLSGGTAIISYSITNGCGSAMSVYAVTVDPLPDAGSIMGDNEECVGITAIMTDHIGGGTWSSSDGAVASVNSLGIVKGLTAGTAFIIYTTTNACGNSTVKYPFTVLPAAACVNEVASPRPSPEERELAVYPNPSTGTFMISFSSPVNEQVQVVVTNMVGVMVKEFTTASNKEQEIELNVPAGVYFLSVSSESGRYVQKVVVE